MKAMNKYIVITIVVLSAALARCLFLVADLRQDRNRLRANQSALLDSVTTYRTKAGEHAASCAALELTVSELKQSRADLAGEIRALNIKLRRVQAAASTVAKTETVIQTVIKDTVIYRDTTAVRLQALKWADPWVTVSGIIEERKADLRIASRDTLLQVVHRVPRRFLGIPYGTKAIRQEIRSSNPHTKIVYTEFVTLKK